MYFNWEKFPFKEPPEFSAQSSGCQVAIIGAGPVGLALALALGRQGKRVVVLEARDQVSDGSRALSLDTLSMRMLDRLGVGKAFSDMCIGREENIVFYRDNLVYEMKYAKDSRQKHDQFNILQQCWMEKLLLDGVAKCPSIDLRWLSRVENVQQHNNHVVLDVSTPEGDYQLKSRYAVATDGGRGQTRLQLDIPYEMVTEEDISDRPFIICDFKLDTAMTKARRFYLDPPYKRGATVLLHAQPFDTWRLDYSVEDDEDPEEEAKPERVRARLDAHLAMIGETSTPEILWTSVYRPRALTASHYRKGNVFLAGDAAHLSPIFGGRGLNLGFGDAFNLAWRLNLVLDEKAADQVLDGYENERQQMVRKTLNDLSQAAVFMARPSKGVTLMCNAILEMVHTEPFVRDLFDAHRAPKREGYSQTGYWNDDPEKGAFAGNPIPNVFVQNKDGSGFLCDMLPEGFSIVVVSDNGALPVAARDALDRLSLKAVIFALAPNAQAACDLSARHGTVLLVRPDGYIAARAEEFDISALAARLDETVLDQSLTARKVHEHA